MVHRPYQQAARLHSERQRDRRWRHWVAGIVTLAVATGALVLSAGSSPSTKGAEAPIEVGTGPMAALLAVADASLPPAAASPAESRGLPWGWRAKVASTGGSDGRVVAGPTPGADSEGAMATPRPGAKPPSAPPTSKEPEDLKGYGWPLYRGRMTNFFGPRDNGFLVIDGRRYHPGLDITTFCGDSVRAAHAGVVVAVGRRFAAEVGFGGSLDRFYGRIARKGTMGLQPIVVVVDDGNGYRSMYVHLAQALVKVGDRVTRRTVIGLEGDTGNASGCHVHYELIRMDGRWTKVAGELVKEYGYPEWQRERVDPLRVLDLKQKRSGRFVPGILRPRLPASLRAPRRQSAGEAPAPVSPSP